MLTNMDVKGSPKARTEIGHQKITRSKAESKRLKMGRSWLKIWWKVW